MFSSLVGGDSRIHAAECVSQEPSRDAQDTTDSEMKTLGMN
jgi:hypothetical protein